MKKLFKYSQQVITGLVLLVAAGGVAFAGPSFDITTLVSGFIRYTGMNHSGCNPNNPGDYCYGYGWSGNLQDWGYGYGYKSKDFSGESDTTLAAEYGFDGDDGAATIDSITTTQTTATIVYSTNYLAKIDGAYGITDPVTPYNYIGLAPGGVSGESDFTSGERVWSITDLTCGTTYYYAINSRDAANNTWPLEDSFTTDSCSSGTQVVGGNVNNPVVIPSSPSLKLRLPPITLALGSIGVDVQDLQILLNHIGVFLDNHGAGSPGEETQYFGKKTFAAVKAFQQVFDLKKVDGIYGIETQTEMAKHLQ